jgi:hypothetical protein
MIRRRSFKVGVFCGRGLLASVGPVIIVLTAVTISVAGPSAAAPRNSTRTGTISGVFEKVGGPPAGTISPLSGAVELTSAGVGIFYRTGMNGSVKGQIPAGHYTATGHPKIEQKDFICPGKRVVVRAGLRTHFVVACYVVSAAG